MIYHYIKLAIRNLLKNRIYSFLIIGGFAIGFTACMLVAVVLIIFRQLGYMKHADFGFNRDFLRWVSVAFILATPVAWFSMHKWLENFAYKTDLSWWIFALAGILALGIALLTVSWQSWRAATRNPVDSLRYE